MSTTSKRNQAGCSNPKSKIQNPKSKFQPFDSAQGLNKKGHPFGQPFNIYLA
jgi:hypothetical protein